MSAAQCRRQGQRYMLQGQGTKGLARSHGRVAGRGQACGQLRQTFRGWQGRQAPTESEKESCIKEENVESPPTREPGAESISRTEGQL